MSTENPEAIVALLELRRLQQIERRYNALREIVSDTFTVRDQLAAAALPTLISGAIALDFTAWDETVKCAYVIADAMMAERAKK